MNTNLKNSASRWVARMTHKISGAVGAGTVKRRERRAPCGVLAAVPALLLAGITLAPGQSQVPGPTDYTGFTRFIANRNIFDPARYPHTTGYIRRVVPRTRNNHAPAFSYVGAMTYDKGMFAFFDGNLADYRQALQVNGKIAGFTVQIITLKGVRLEAGGKTIDLAVGDQMQFGRDGAWEPAGQSEGFAGQTASSAPGAATGSGSGSAAADSSAAVPVPTGPQSDVLKRLMQLRQQENK
jgi:hypothetical protein